MEEVAFRYGGVSKNIEKTVTDSQQRVVLQPGGWALLTIKNHHIVACYTGKMDLRKTGWEVVD
jgi:hypothetical protein